jgi:transcriptional regulator with XRE-family HTH domain
VQKAFAEEKAARNLTQAEIARALGVDRSVINRQLMGTENLTVRRIGELAWALGRDLNFSLTKPVARMHCNIATSGEGTKANVPTSVLSGSAAPVVAPVTTAVAAAEVAPVTSPYALATAA